MKSLEHHKAIYFTCTTSLARLRPPTHNNVARTPRIGAHLSKFLGLFQIGDRLCVASSRLLNVSPWHCHSAIPSHAHTCCRSSLATQETHISHVRLRISKDRDLRWLKDSKIWKFTQLSKGCHPSWKGAVSGSVPGGTSQLL
jgi:hypothetical protein